MLTRKHIKPLNLKKPVGLHTFRHTIATHLIQSGMSLMHVQEFLGHETLNATLKYVHLNVKDLQREYNRTFNHAI
jgi:site-specific recombinase XerD